MEVKVFDSVDAAAKGAAAVIAAEARAAVAARGRFVMAVSGGHTPWQMLRAMAAEDVPWKDVHVAQVDERVAPANDPDRNLAHLRESLLAHAPLTPGADPRDAGRVSRPGGRGGPVCRECFET